MIKAISAIAVAAFIAAALSVLPGFAPQVEASVPQALAKGGRLDSGTIGRDCAQQGWPNFRASCLRGAGTTPRSGAARSLPPDAPRYRAVGSGVPSRPHRGPDR